MTVKQLIEDLKTQDQNAEIVVVEKEQQWLPGWMRLQSGKIAIMSSGVKVK